MDPTEISPLIGWDLAEQGADHRGLARAVRSEDRDLAAAFDRDVEGAEDGLAVVAGGQALGGDHDPVGSARLGEREPGADLLAVGDVDLFELLQRLDAALDLAGLGGLVAEAVDELLGLGHLARLVGGLGFEPFDPLLALDHEVEEAARVFGRRAVGHLDDVGGDPVDEVAVVADEQQRLGPAGEMVLEPGDAVDVEVVGGLVEDQHVGRRQQEASQREPHPPAAGQLLHAAIGVAGGEPEAGEHPVGLGLDGVAAELLEAALELAVAGDHLVGLVAGGSGHPILQLGQLPLELGDVLGASQRLLQHGALLLGREVLGEIAEP